MYYINLSMSFIAPAGFTEFSKLYHSVKFPSLSRLALPC